MTRSLASRLSETSIVGRAAVSMYGRVHGVTVTFAADHIAFERAGRELHIARRDFPYSRDMIDAFESYHGSVDPNDQGIVDFSRPGIHRYRRSGLCFSLPAIAEEDDAIAAYFRWFTPAAGDTVFDIGAHAGVSTHLLSVTVGPTGHVFAFEPDPVALEHLSRNVAAHALHNVTIVPKAIAGRAGRLSFQAEGSIGSALAEVASRPGTGRLIGVDAITLSAAFDLAGERPTYIKMDIEGAELEVIASSRDLLLESPTHLSIDSNHTVGGAHTAARLEVLLRAIGYETESSDAFGFMTTWARPGSLGDAVHPDRARGDVAA